jgi:hypothetical protein
MIPLLFGVPFLIVASRFLMTPGPTPVTWHIILRALRRVLHSTLGVRMEVALHFPGSKHGRTLFVRPVPSDPCWIVSSPE